MSLESGPIQSIPEMPQIKVLTPAGAALLTKTGVYFAPGTPEDESALVPDHLACVADGNTGAIDRESPDPSDFHDGMDQLVGGNTTEPLNLY